MSPKLFRLGFFVAIDKEVSMNEIEVKRSRQALQAAKRKLEKGMEARVPETRLKVLRRVMDTNLRRYRDAIAERELLKG